MSIAFELVGNSHFGSTGNTRYGVTTQQSVEGGIKSLANDTFSLKWHQPIALEKRGHDTTLIKVSIPNLEILAARVATYIVARTALSYLF